MTPQEMLAHISKYIDEKGCAMGDVDTFCLALHGDNTVEGISFGSMLTIIGMLEDTKRTILNDRPRQAPDNA